MALVFDADIYSRELAGQLVALGRRDGPLPVRFEEYLGEVEEIPDVARRLAEGRPDLVVYAGIAGPGTGRMVAQIEARLPGVPYTRPGPAGARSGRTDPSGARDRAGARRHAAAT